MNRYHIIVSGQVQGVGFRYFCVMNAQKLNLTGSVRNMDNGMVEIFVQGQESAIRTFLNIIEQGNLFINVTDYSIKKIDIEKNESSFRYLM